MVSALSPESGDPMGVLVKHTYGPLLLSPLEENIPTIPTDMEYITVQMLSMTTANKGIGKNSRSVLALLVPTK